MDAITIEILDSSSGKWVRVYASPIARMGDMVKLQVAEPYERSVLWVYADTVNRLLWQVN